MNKKGTYMLGIVIMAFGIVLFLGQLGINIRWIIGLAIASYFVYKGWGLFVEIENSIFKKGFGICLLLVGVLWLTALIPVILGILVAGLLIYYGIKLVKNHQTYKAAPEMVAMGEEVNRNPFAGDHSFNPYDELDEWENQINKDDK
ncbi:MFS transporter [Calidifontibacillus oryziterrae]|uniref:hypothetical protein n=1 Tax=Calidifontibacillus oryziterrae TaxID=1191699 RepID=UPI0002F05B62|nr:hypothetical protein [Calidifontibacillus oryziterrae]